MGLFTSKQSSVQPKQNKRVPFLLQPHCTSFRNMHAYIEDGTNDIVIDDLTYNKTFKINNATDKSRTLRVKVEPPPGLLECNVIGYHWNLAILQIFYADSTQVIVCNLTELNIISTFRMCPCFKPDSSLCEAYISENRQYLILKCNDGYLRAISELKRNRAMGFNDNNDLVDSVWFTNRTWCWYTYTDNPRGGILVSSTCYKSDTSTACVYRDQRIFKETKREPCYPALDDVFFFKGSPSFNTSSLLYLSCLYPSKKTYCSSHGMETPVMFEVNATSCKLGWDRCLFYIPLSIFLHSLKQFTNCVQVSIFNTNIDDHTYKFKYDRLYDNEPPCMWRCKRIELVERYSASVSASKPFKSLFRICGDTIVDLVLPEDISALPLPTSFKEKLLYRTYKEADVDVHYRPRSLFYCCY